MKKRLVVLGGSGFIGFNISRLLKSKFELYLVDRVSPSFDMDEAVSFNQMDIKDRKDLKRFFTQIDPHYVINLAAQSTIGVCHENPTAAFLDNVYGNWNVLTHLLEHQNKKKSSFEKLIVHSSDKAYGVYPEDQLPYKESYGHFPSDIYSTSKACQDMISISWSRSLGLKACVVRSGNVYGPGDLNFSRLVPSVLSRLIKDRPPILYSGAESAVRDFVFVEDLICAYEMLLEEGKEGEAYNIGGSGPMPVIEAINMMKKVLSKAHFKSELFKRDVQEFSCQYLDSSKVQDLGWSHFHSFEKGISKTIPFYVNYQKKVKSYA